MDYNWKKWNDYQQYMWNEANRFQILPDVYSTIVQHNQYHVLFPIVQIVHTIDLDVDFSIVFYIDDRMHYDNLDRLLSMLLDSVQ